MARDTPEISASIVIDAPAAEIWAVLIDFARYGEWNPFIRSVEGVAEVGTRLRAVFHPPGGSAMTLRPRVLEVAAGRMLRWRGHVLVPGLFDGDHRFTLAALPTGGTTFTQDERFTGLLARPLMGGKMRATTEAAFVAMNQALERRVKSRTA